MCIALRWDPADGALTRWPEPDMLVEDASRPTGFRFEYQPSAYPAIRETLAAFETTFSEDLTGLDGFGVNSELFFRFDGPLTLRSDTVGSASDGVGIVVLSPGPVRFLAADLELADESETVFLMPREPLPEGGLAAAYITQSAFDGCVAPSGAMAMELAANDQLRAAINELSAAGTIGSEEDLAALTVFPVQTIAAPSVAVAEAIAQAPLAFAGPATCGPEGDLLRCETTLEVGDYRTAEGRVPEGPPIRSRTYDLPVSVWLPSDGTRPFPTIVFGHGLGSSREEAAEFAAVAAPEGFAVVAVDALRHGEHPDRNPDAARLATVTEFFALGDLQTRPLDAGKARDHFRQSTFDKLQLTEALRAGADLDGDGQVDLDPERLSYLGVSLGGIMGPELLALTDAYPSAALVVAGGRLTSVLTGSETYGALLSLFRPPGATDGDLRRYFTVLQTAIDRGDAASYTPRILRDRPRGDRAPSVLLTVVLDDDTVPNVATYALARALRTPLVASVLRPVQGVEVLEPVPVMGNAAEGLATTGLLQFDVIADGRAATHGNMPQSPVGARAWLEFFRSQNEDGLAQVVDPYAVEGLAHAE